MVALGATNGNLLFMDGRIESTRFVRFYAMLTPEQQKIFNEQTTHHGMHGEMHGQKQDK